MTSAACVASAVAVAAVTVAACGGSTGSSGEGSESCGLVVRYDDRTYAGQVIKRAPEERQALGTGTIPACDRREADTDVTVAEIAGVSPHVGLAWNGEPLAQAFRVRAPAGEAAPA